MPGPLPKDPKLRQRANKASTRATLPARPKRRRAPKLPIAEPHPLTVAFWKDVWRSPMAGEYLEADLHGLYVLAQLVDDFWQAPSTAKAAEIRQQRQPYGLTPIDRRRLEWSISDDEPVPEQKPKAASDARSVLKVIA